MKISYQITAAIVLAAFLFSCNRQKTEEKKQDVIASITPVKKELEVKYIGVVRTRRTFADIQFIQDEKELDRYVAAQERSNPLVFDIVPYRDSSLLKGFEKLGLIKKSEFIQARFKPQTQQKTSFIDSAKRAFPVKFYNDILKGNVHFKIFLSKDSIDIDTGATSLQNLDYAFLDIIPGGNKELVFLDDYHIMNGDNFDLMVYEIKTH